ncbi:MAG: hypothetical protein ACTFAK_09280 [Candidatus Electronema sp. VV]
MKRFFKQLPARLLFLLLFIGKAEASDLILAGTVVGAGVRSAAVFREGGQQYLLYEGDLIGAAVIEKVDSDRVTLAAADRKAVLLLNSGRTEQTTTANDGARAVLPPDLMPPPPPPAPMPVPAD